MRRAGRVGALATVLASVAVVAATAAPLVASASGRVGTSTRKPAASALVVPPPPPVIWGATVKNGAKQTQLQAVQAFQTLVQRNLRATRDFLSWDSVFPTAYEQGLAAQGTTLLVSVATRTLHKTAIPWSAVAAATVGSPVYLQMQSWADRIRDFGSPVWVTLQHEPEASVNNLDGSQADYIAAWRNWVSVFRAEGAVKVRFMFITTAYGYTVKPTDRRYVPAFYPGDDVVDAIAVDAYNWSPCAGHTSKGWASLATVIEGQRLFSLAHPAQQLWVSEFGSVEDPANPAHRAQWFADAEALFAQANYSRYSGVVYFDLKASCDWRVDTWPLALAAFTTMGADPYYAG